MASTYSTSLRLELMATGDQSGTWGDTTNTNLGTLLEQAIAGVLSVAEGDAELTLTALDGASDQSRNMVVELTGAMTGAQNVIVPTAEKLYLIKNSTTGGYAVTVKTTAGTGVTVPATTTRWVYCDGTNVVDGQSGPWAPSANDAQALGLSATAWSDLFLASGGVVNWNAGDVTITHSANTLAFAGASSGYSFDAAVAVTGALTAASAVFTSTDAGAAAAPVLELYRNSASPAASDVLGQLLFNGEDSAGNTQEYGSIQAAIVDPTSTSEDSKLDLYALLAGTRTLMLSVGGGAASGVYVPGVIDLGNASDTTISRGAAGFIAVEGNRVPSPASQASGDILYRGATEWARLAKGTAAQVLTMNAGATAPEWAAASAGGQPIPTSSALAVGSAAYLLNSSGGTITNNSTTAGSGLYLWVKGATAGNFTATGVQSGTWKNITGGSVGDAQIGYFVRTA